MEHGAPCLCLLQLENYYIDLCFMYVLHRYFRLILHGEDLVKFKGGARWILLPVDRARLALPLFSYSPNNYAILLA